MLVTILQKHLDQLAQELDQLTRSAAALSLLGDRVVALASGKVAADTSRPIASLKLRLGDLSMEFPYDLPPDKEVEMLETVLGEEGDKVVAALNRARDVAGQAADWAQNELNTWRSAPAAT